MSDLGRLYQDTILAHHRAPRFAGRLEHPTHAADGNNPLCGDRVGVTLEIADGHVRDVRCDVKGCAICRASGSLMAEAIVGRRASDVQVLIEEFLQGLECIVADQMQQRLEPLHTPPFAGFERLAAQ